MTLNSKFDAVIDVISIHTALAGCDVTAPGNSRGFRRFQSTQPSQAVTLFHFRSHADCRISIHTALAGCDVEVLAVAFNMEISIHTALAGCDKNFSAQSDSS